MKSLRKNGYAVLVIAFFTIALAMLVLFLALFSSSTAVDGTTVGSVYIGDVKPNTEARKKKLTQKVEEWKKDARYTISFQNYSYTIGRTDRVDDNGDPVYDKNTGEQLFDDKGLYILDFNYDKTNTNIIQDSTNNDAVFEISDSNKELLLNILVETFGSTVTSDVYFEYDKLIKAILKDADEMNTKCDYDLYDYLKTTWTEDCVSQVDIENLDKEKVNTLFEIFGNKDIVIAPQKSEEGKLGFSTVDFFSRDEFAEVGLTSSDMSIIATGFAAVVQNSSLTVTVKNQGYVSDKYYAYGHMTARVNIKDGTDLRIMNPETHAYTIKIEKGEKIIDGKTSLKFLLIGCHFVNKFTIQEVPTTIKNSFSIVYDINPMDNLEYDKSCKDPNYNGGCYYMVYQEGIETVLYSYTKITTYVDGKTSETEVYPKQEFFVGQDELRHWSSQGYKA